VEEAWGDAGLRWLALALALCGLGLLSGCGGDGDEESSSTSAPQPLSKQAYEDQFNAIVAKFEADPKPDAPPPGASPEQQGEALAQGLEKTRRLAGELDRLDPPADIRHAHDQFVEGLREIADQAEVAVDALRAGDEAKARRLVSSFAKPATLAKITRARQEFARKGYHLGEVTPSP
jgi:hypothetical protein